MSDVDEINCDDMADMAAELALGVLDGRERAQAIAHLDRCDACRENVRQLTLTGEGLLGLLPPSEPPAGFETRVVARLGTAGQRPKETRRKESGPKEARLRRTRHMLATAAVALVAAACGLGGWGLRGTASPPSQAHGGTSQSILRTAALVTAAHRPAGQVFLYNGRPGWLYMNVETGSGNGTVICQLQSRDGHITTVGSFQLTGGSGYWGSPDPVNPATVTGARLTTSNGTVVATASFPGTS
jgi:hypothetical protein